MKTLKINSHNRKIIRWLLLPSIIFIIFGLYSCEEEELLKEKVLASVSDEGVLSTRSGFEAYMIGLVRQFREEWQMDDGTYRWQYKCTDMFSFMGMEGARDNWLQVRTSVASHVRNQWHWAYTQMIPQANNIINYADLPENEDIWASEADKNAMIAEARFFRAWTYNNLANLYGGVPIIDKVLPEPRYDYVRASREEVYEFAKADLEFAVEWLPTTVPPDKEGRVVKAAADHLLSEVYISLGEYANAITSASKVIDSDLYQLMTTRFGGYTDEPGDVFSDLFKENNYNRSSGNMESILVWQVEEYTEGGTGTRSGNHMLRGFGPFLVHIKDPDGYSMLVTDGMGRGVGGQRGSEYALYTIWQDDWDDMRNSPYNMRREFYYNNPASPYYLKKWEIAHMTSVEDTMRSLYAYSRKVEGMPWEGNKYSCCTKNDHYVMRLAETYLLRAEAYLRNGDANKAAEDINVVRARANATPVLPGDVTIDYILDERARELMIEEPRVRTLIRMGKLVERVRLYDIDWVSRETVEDYHGLWPIPQKAIDANTDAVLEQNPGY